MDIMLSAYVSISRFILPILLIHTLLIHARSSSRRSPLRHNSVYFSHEHVDKTPVSSFCPVQQSEQCMCLSVLPADTMFHRISCAGGDPYHFPRFSPHHNTTILRLSLVYDELRQIPYDAFGGLKILKLDLRGNNFTNLVHPRAFLGIAKQLHYLDLQWSNLTKLTSKVFRGMVLLQNLSLAQNHLRHIPRGLFQDLCRLRRLSLTGNSLGKLSTDVFRYQTNLEHMDLSYCHLRHVSFGLLFGLWNLRHLDLRGNRIISLEMQAFMDLYSLDTLLLTHNPITSLESRVFVGLVNLRQLRIEESHLEYIAFDVFHDTHNLRLLDLGDNRLRDLAFGTFFIPRLEQLSLDGNRLTVMPAELRYLAYLQRLDLSYNQLTQVDLCTLEKMSNLRHLNLRENPFNCNCATMWLRRLRSQMMKKWDQKSDFPFLPGKCEEPSHLRGVVITSWIDFDCLRDLSQAPRCAWH